MNRVTSESSLSSESSDVNHFPLPGLHLHDSGCVRRKETKYERLVPWSPCEARLELDGAWYFSATSGQMCPEMNRRQVHCVPGISVKIN